MPSSSDNSFIPKRGPVKSKASAAPRQVFIFTYISYVLTFATLLSVGAVFLYGQYVDKQLDTSVANLNNEISGFSGERLAEVVDFDLRLEQATARLNNSVSIVSVFDALEDSIINTVQIEKLALERQGDEKFLLSASIVTDTFDSTIFQRSIFEQGAIISKDVVVTDVTTNSNEGGEGETTVAVSDEPVVTFVAELEVPLTNVPYVPASGNQENTMVPETIVPVEVSTSSATTTTDDVVTSDEDLEANETDI